MSVIGLRNRVEGAYTSSAARASYWWNTSQNPKPQPVYSYSAQRVGTVKDMTDYVTPGYKQRSAQGEIINTEMWSNKSTRTLDNTGPMFSATIAGTPSVTYVGDLQGPGWTAGALTSPFLPTGVSAPSYDSLMDIAKTRCYANIDKPDFQSQVTLGEFRETIGFLRNPFKSGLALAETLNGKLRRAGVFDKSVKLDKRKLRNDLASGYLAFQYGLKPLVKEIVGILENLRPKLIPRPKRETARAKETQEYTYAWTARESFSGISYTAAYTYKRTVTIRCGILYENKAAATEFDKWGFRPKDIPLAVWQVTSLSFVVDWFANVGDFVSAITPSAGTRTLAMWTKVTIEEELTRQVSAYTFSAPYITIRDGSGKDSVKRVTVHRDPRNFAPSLAFRDLTELKNDASRLTSLVALFTTRVGDLTPYEPKRAYRFVNTKRWRGTGD